MKSSLYHLQINVSDLKISAKFYRDFLGYFGYRVSSRGPFHLGLTNGTTDFWLIQTSRKYLKEGFHRKRIGLNHLAFRVKRKTDVDRFVREFLQSKKMSALYHSARLFPQYQKDYYAVYFEDPDRIKLEVVYLS